MKEIGRFHIKNKETSFYQLDKDLIFTNRFDFYSQEKTIIETFANNWFVGFITESPLALKIRSENSLLELKNNMGILIPPFSILEWHIGPGKLDWKGIFSKTPLVNPSPKAPLIFSDFHKIPTTQSELGDLLKKIKPLAEIKISKNNSWLAEKTKEFIDKHFKEDLKVEDIANHLKVHRSFMTRSFKKAYGLSPIEYRHKLRIFEGLKLMNQENLEVTQAAVDSGFSCIQRFEEHFKEQFGVTPSQFHFSRFQKVKI